MGVQRPSAAVNNVPYDTYFLSAHFLFPLLLLVALRVSTKFPVWLAGLLFLVGPLLGSVAYVCVLDFARHDPHFDLSRILGGTLAFYIVGGLPLFGLWVVDCGIFGWWMFGKSQWITKLRASYRAFSGLIVGGFFGALLNVVFWTVTELDPHWPFAHQLAQDLLDPVARFNIILQGLLAGAACGSIIALALPRKVGSAASTESIRSRAIS